MLKNVAGPSIILSFVVAAAASILAGLCYAEFGARVPKTGSAYVYTYVTIGEFMAFIIGWNLILEYVIGTSSVARAFSSYFDSLIDNKIQNFFLEHMPMHVPGLSKYPDFFAFAITLLITAVLAIGVKESSRMNNLFTGVNLFVVSFIIVAGFIKADLKNWELKPSDLPTNNSTWINKSLPCNTTGSPAWDRLGLTSGWENNNVTEGELDVRNSEKARVTASMDSTTVSPTLISHAPRSRVRHAWMRAAGVLGAIEARCTLPSRSYRLRPPVACLERSNFRRSTDWSNAS